MINYTLACYMQEIWCVCPRCKDLAVVRVPSDKPFFFFFPSSARVTCSRCPFVKSWKAKRGNSLPVVFLEPRSLRDPIFGLPLFLSTSVRGNPVFALNAAHLEDLRSYVAAKLRPRPQNSKWSTFSRLPGWFVASANRAHVLRALKRLEAKLQR